MTFEEFLKLMNEKAPNKCPVKFWAYQYKLLEVKNQKGVMREMPYLMVRSFAYKYRKENK